MKTKIALLIVAVSFAIAAPSVAQAGKVEQAKRIVDRVMVHIGNFAAILDKNMASPDKAIAQLQAYFKNKKNIKAFKGIAHDMKALALSPDDNKALQQYAMTKKEIHKLMKAAMAFGQKNPGAAKQMGEIFKQLKDVFPK